MLACTFSGSLSLHCCFSSLIPTSTSHLVASYGAIALGCPFLSLLALGSTTRPHLRHFLGYTLAATTCMRIGKPISLSFLAAAQPACMWSALWPSHVPQFCSICLFINTPGNILCLNPSPLLLCPILVKDLSRDPSPSNQTYAMFQMARFTCPLHQLVVRMAVHAQA